MSTVLRFDHGPLEEAGRHLMDVSAEFQRRTQAAFAVVHGTGETAWAGSVTGTAMDGIIDLLQQACERLHGNLQLTGEGIQTMAHTLHKSELDAQAIVDPPRAAPDVPSL
ncbi:hypothetical protein [Nonomuraea cavernae]|uniref:Uncharacterized protein n=1 Tax=Nonomuraea cavernae TaxID=2045107 RepID=A0A917Z3Z7_9ACTN|nr:hypothetical protein [Nonomuraea cavernae]MCA2188437.1 hypothetical protein [Nonomuraea cavernae]GGO73328.1 hypothetical protein GCM10012289_43460 [Nonomuraea cavernae]